MRRLLTFLWLLPASAMLVATGRRFLAEPFEYWSKRCPACGESYRDHEQQTLGGVPAPGLGFIEALDHDQWNRVRTYGFAPFDGAGLRGWIGTALSKDTRTVVLFTHLSRSTGLGILPATIRVLDSE